jgi:hypothetical protein
MPLFLIEIEGGNNSRFVSHSRPRFLATIFRLEALALQWECSYLHSFTLVVVGSDGDISSLYT